MQSKLKYLALMFLAMFILLPACGGENGTGDGSAPTIAITSPTDGATLSDTFTVTASGSSDVTKVTFYFDGKLDRAVTTKPFSTEIKLGDLANGSYQIQAVAENAAGLTATVSITITISRSTAPNITLAAPSQGSTKTTDFAIEVNANGGSSAIKTVKFFFNDLQTPFSTKNAPANGTVTSDNVNIGSLPTGTHQYDIKAVVENMDGATATVNSFVYVYRSGGGDVTAPVISGITPTENETISTNFKIGATVTEPESVVTGVTFYFNGSKVTNDTTAPYQSSLIDISALPNGTYTIGVVASNSAPLVSSNGYTITIQKSVVQEHLYLTLVPIAEDYSPFLAETQTNEVADPTIHWDPAGITGIQSYYITVWDENEENLLWSIWNVGNAYSQVQYGNIPSGAEQVFPESGAPSPLADNTTYIVNVVGSDNAVTLNGNQIAVAHLKARIELSGSGRAVVKSTSAPKTISKAEYLMLLDSLKNGLK